MIYYKIRDNDIAWPPSGHSSVVLRILKKNRACFATHTNINLLKYLKTKDKSYKCAHTPFGYTKLTHTVPRVQVLYVFLIYRCLLRYAYKHNFIEIKTLKSNPLGSKTLESKNKRQNLIERLKSDVLAITPYWV